LKEHGVKATGIINYPLLNQTQEVTLTPGNEEELDGIVKDIQTIINGAIPEITRKRICSKCAYLEFCFSTEERGE